MIDFKKYKRFFAFGCSMTSYYWPTWADIIAKEIPESYNYGKSGGGNLFISNQLTEANQRFNFNKDDLVMVMWSSIHREDRYINRYWETPGNIYTQGTYDKNFIKKFADVRGYFIRDMALITMSLKLLESTGADFYMLKMSPFEVGHGEPAPQALIEDVRALYRTTIDKIKPDILNLELNGRWPQIPIKGRGHGQTADYHPTPEHHANYIKKVFPGLEFSPATVDFIQEHMVYLNQVEYLDELAATWRTQVPPRL